jgi:glutamate 5-kinase
MVRIDAGALKALKAGRSLLPAGVTNISGGFSRGELVRILNDSDQDLGCGLIAFDSGEAQLILGCHTNEVENILGYASRGALIHRDDMVLQG